MPTIDELAPATAAADTDEFPVNQNNVTRKLTRAQILTGVQTDIVIPGGSLVGRESSGLGGFETISVGNYLNLTAGTLNALAEPFSIAALPSGVVPSAVDLVALGQGGTNVSIPYRTFLQGLTEVTGLDGGNLLVTPTGSSIGLRIADLAISFAPLTGASMTGPLLLSGDPTQALQAVTKQMVDGKINRLGDTFQGAVQLAGNPTTALQAATKSYVDSNAGFPRAGFTMSGPIVLASDPVTSLNPATKNYADARVSRAGDTMLGILALAADPVSKNQAATKNYVDIGLAMALNLSGGTMVGALTLAADPTGPVQASTKQYADTKLARTGDTMSGYLTLSGSPSTPLQAATKNYVDNQALALLPSAGGTMTGPLLLAGNPTLPTHAATKYYIDSGIASMLPLSGGTISGLVSMAAAPSGPANLTNKQYVDGKASSLLPLSGGTLSGPLNLSAAPTAPLHASTKQYVDANPASNGVVNVKLPPCGAHFDGVTDDTPAFIAAYQLVPPGGAIYVPAGTTVLQKPSAWGIPLSKHVKWIVDGTTLADGTLLADAIPAGTTISATGGLPGTVSGTGLSGLSVSQSQSQATDFCVAHTSYVVNHSGGATQSPIINSRTDTVVTANPNNHVWSGVDSLTWAGGQTGSATSPSRYIGRLVRASRQSYNTGGTTSVAPQPNMWATYQELIDATGQPSSLTNGSVTAEMDWIGNGIDDANSRAIQSLVLAQYNLSGPAAEIGSAVSVSVLPGSSGMVYRVFNVAVPFSVAVLDTTGATQSPGAAAIRLAAGQLIAFEPTNSVNLGLLNGKNTIVAKYGSTTCAVGRGLSVSYGIVIGSNSNVPASAAGSVVFLVGNGSYSVGLPPAASLAAGTGFTFSVLGTVSVSIVAVNGDILDLAPVMLRQYDRYHIVTDGVSVWREIFRTNAVSPHFLAPPVLPSYTVSNLPSAPSAGAKAFAANGRKPGETSGSGTGVETFFDGVQWISSCAGTPIQA